MLMLQEWANGHRDPLGIDILVPKCEERWGCVSIPCEAVDVANPEGEHCGRCCGKQCAHPHPVVVTMVASPFASMPPCRRPSSSGVKCTPTP